MTSCYVMLPLGTLSTGISKGVHLQRGQAIAVCIVHSAKTSMPTIARALPVKTVKSASAPLGPLRIAGRILSYLLDVASAQPYTRGPTKVAAIYSVGSPLRNIHVGPSPQVQTTRTLHQ